jgi:homocysteine S-methyltransferase
LISDLLLSVISEKPFVVYPNSGRSWNANTKEWEGNSGSGFGELLVKSWISAGAQIIGGCCGIGADELLNLNL